VVDVDPGKKSMSKKKYRSAKVIKRELQILERELNNLIRIQWNYAKRMLKFGMGVWLLGIGIFVLAVAVSKGPELLTELPPFVVGLLISGAAVPPLVTALIIRRFSSEIKRYERMRRRLLLEYERSLLREVEELISSR